MNHSEKEVINNLIYAVDQPRPLYEQTLLAHLDDLLQFTQYDAVTDEERHKAYHAATSILSMFVNNNRPIPNHYLEWLIELCTELTDMKGA